MPRPVTEKKVEMIIRSKVTGRVWAKYLVDTKHKIVKSDHVPSPRRRQCKACS